MWTSVSATVLDLLRIVARIARRVRREKVGQRFACNAFSAHVLARLHSAKGCYDSVQRRQGARLTSASSLSPCLPAVRGATASKRSLKRKRNISYR